MFSSNDWILYVNLKQTTAKDYVNFIKYYFMKDIFFHIPTVLCNKEMDIEYLNVQNQEIFENTIKRCDRLNRARNWFSL